MYILLLTYLVCLIIKYDFGENKTQFNLHYTLLLLLVIFMAGFSYRMGTDSVKYESEFDSYTSNLSNLFWEISDREFLQPLWTSLNVLVRSLSGSFTIMKLLIAAFVNSTIFWFLRKHSSYFFLSVLLYFLMIGWTINFEILRGAIAISFFLIGFDNLCCEKPSYKKYYLWCIPAMLFHTFAALLLLVPILLKIRPGKAFYIGLIVCAILSPLIITYANELLNMRLFYLVEGRVDTYVNGETFGSRSLNLNGMIYVFLFQILPLSYICMNSKNEDSKILAIAIAYIFVVILRIGLGILYRITDVFAILLIVTICNSLRDHKKSIFKLICLALFSVSLISPLLSDSAWPKYVPYTSIFNKRIIPERESLYYKNLL